MRSTSLPLVSSSGYSNKGKAGAFVAVRNYQEKNGEAQEADSILEASAAAVYAACSAGGKIGGPLRSESGKKFDSTIVEKGGKNINKIKGLL